MSDPRQRYNRGPVYAIRGHFADGLPVLGLLGQSNAGGSAYDFGPKPPPMDEATWQRLYALTRPPPRKARRWWLKAE